jgi:hypothetical protein
MTLQSTPGCCAFRNQIINSEEDLKKLLYTCCAFGKQRKVISGTFLILKKDVFKDLITGLKDQDSNCVLDLDEANVIYCANQNAPLSSKNKLFASYLDEITFDTIDPTNFNKKCAGMIQTDRRDGEFPYFIQIPDIYHGISAYAEIISKEHEDSIKCFKYIPINRKIVLRPLSDVLKNCKIRSLEDLVGMRLPKGYSVDFTRWSGGDNNFLSSGNKIVTTLLNHTYSNLYCTSAPPNGGHGGFYLPLVYKSSDLMKKTYLLPVWVYIPLANVVENG